MSRVEMSQIAAMNISYQFYSFDYFLESVASIGYTVIDIWTGYPHMLFDEDYAEQARYIRKRCDGLGLRVDNITPKVIGWPLNIAAESEKIRANAIAYLKRCIDAAEILGAKSLQLVPGTGLYDHPVEPAWERSRQSLGEIARYAQEQEKTLVLEAIQIVESNLINNREQLQRMVREVNNPALGAVVDTTHMEKNGETLDDYFSEMGDMIRRVHLNEKDQLPWGEGGSPLDTYLEQLNSHSFSGPFTIEICSRPHYLEPHKAMQDTYAHVNAALERQRGYYSPD